MPTVLRSGPYRVYFFSHDTTEPPHVHVDRGDFSAKFWLEPIDLERNTGFRPQELRKIQALLTENRKELVEKWHGYFSAGSRRKS